MSSYPHHGVQILRSPSASPYAHPNETRNSDSCPPARPTAVTAGTHAIGCGLYQPTDTYGRRAGGSAINRNRQSEPDNPSVSSTEQDLTGTAAFDATGDHAVMPSWDELVREHADRVYRLAYRLAGNPQDAEDLTQETFIRVFRSLSNYQPGTFEGWLHRITTNLFLDMVRRRGRIRMEALPEDYERVPATGPTPEQVYHEARLDPTLQSALDALAPEFRAAVVLCDIEGLSYEEIAATLGAKLGTVRSRIHRGRQALREHLEHNGAWQPKALAATAG